MLLRWLLALMMAAALPVHAEERAAQTVVHILDYVAGDYGGAVEAGRVKSADEYREMVEFTTQVVEQLKALPPSAQSPALGAQAAGLQQLVANKADAPEVAQAAGKLRWAIIGAYKLAITPERTPDLKRATVLYAENCAACHGAQGRGDGPAARGMEPKPADFHDAQRMAKRDAYSLYNTITLGVAGTAMKGYAQLSDDDRWGLAFHVASLGGARRAPLAYAKATLNETLAAYRKGDNARAQQLAVAAYLEGFELVEPALDALDHDLRTTIEADMLRVRTLMREGASADVLEAHVTRTSAELDAADQKLGGTSLSPTAAATSAFIILLREGLEAILLLAAIVAFLVKAGRRDALRYIHAGWIAALALGIVTWFVARFVVSVSGASREMTEGVTALASAGILLYVGWWLHDKSHASAWRQFIDQRLAGALSRGTVGALASLSFLAVYREVFETVLFYEALWVQAGDAAHGALFAGFAAGGAVLAVTAWLIFRYGVRLPIGLFFGVSAAFLALLAVVFAGQGVKALQEAGAIAVTAIDFPRISALGVFPTVQSLAAQACVVLVVLAVFARGKLGAGGTRR
jgi:high-affinity iron transporter